MLDAALRIANDDRTKDTPGAELFIVDDNRMPKYDYIITRSDSILEDMI